MSYNFNPQDNFFFRVDEGMDFKMFWCQNTKDFLLNFNVEDSCVESSLFVVDADIKRIGI